MPPDKEPETKDDDLVVQIIEDDQIDLFDDGPDKKPDKTDEQETEKPRRKAAKKPDGDDAIAQLKRQLDEANAGIKAEKEARASEAAKRSEMERELADARKRGETAEGDAISNAKSAAQAEADKHQADLAKAWEDGDYAKASDIQRKLARAEAVLLHLDREEADYKERKETAPKEPEKKAEAPATPKTPTNVDEWLAEANLPERAKKFFRDHPEFAPVGKSKAKWYMLQAAHEEAVEEGIQFDTGDYYNFLGKRLINDEGDDVEDDTENDDKRVPAAPVSRGAPTRGPNGGVVIKAKREWVEAAAEQGMSIKKYMEIRNKLIAEGVIKENE